MNIYESAKQKIIFNCYLFIFCAGLVFIVRYVLSSCGAQAWLPCSMWGLSSLTRDPTHVLYVERQILNHWTTREVPKACFLNPVQ